MIEFLQALANSAAYSFFGFAVGWLVGYEARSIEELRRGSLTQEGDLMTGNPPISQLRSKKIGFFLIVLALFTVLQSGYFSFQQHKATACLSHYNESLSEVQTIRADWAEEDRQALISFFTVVRNPKSTKREREVAFEVLTGTYDRNTERRKETPLPSLKECD